MPNALSNSSSYVKISRFIKVTLSVQLRIRIGESRVKNKMDHARIVGFWAGVFTASFLISGLILMFVATMKTDEREINQRAKTVLEANEIFYSSERFEL